MAISLSYACTCGFSTGFLEDAQEHVNKTVGHLIHVRGTISANVPQVDPTAIAASAQKKMEDAEILRIARDRGLIGVKR